MSFRKEKKFRLSYSDMIALQGHLIASGMKPLYPSRTINSCYFDTRDLRLYHESEDGVLPRKKIRVRWYSGQSQFSKEVKVSSIEGRFKVTDKLTSCKTLSDIKCMRFFDPLYGDLHPTIVVSYERAYYSLDGLRITFDKNITYLDMRTATPTEYKDSESVVEVKVPIDCDDDYIEKRIFHPTSRFSKYSRGLLFIEGML